MSFVWDTLVCPLKEVSEAGCKAHTPVLGNNTSKCREARAQTQQLPLRAAEASIPSRRDHTHITELVPASVGRVSK